MPPWTQVLGFTVDSCCSGAVGSDALRLGPRLL